MLKETFNFQCTHNTVHKKTTTYYKKDYVISYYTYNLTQVTLSDFNQNMLYKHLSLTKQEVVEVIKPSDLDAIHD